MNGLERITEHIISDAKAVAKEKLSAAQVRVGQIQQECEEELSKLKAASQQNVSAEKKRADENVAYALRAREREAMLRTHNELANEFIAEAKGRVLDLPDNEYFDFLMQVYKNNAQQGEGEILLCKKDKERMPADFIEKLNGICPKVTLSDEDSPKPGFIIRCGRVENNCTIDAIFEERKNKLADIVAARCKE